jgi:hypothetical protein
MGLISNVIGKQVTIFWTIINKMNLSMIHKFLNYGMLNIMVRKD